MEEEIETKKKRKWPKVLIWVGVIVFIAGAIAANIYYMRLQTPAISKEKLNIMTVKGKTMKETMIASGKVVPADIAYVYRAPSKGGIAEVFVQEGDKVQKGDRLLRYKGTGMGELDSLRLQKERLQMQMDHREEKIADLAEQIDDAKAEGLP
ncbi:MAG TPA: efflux RND transporter periplasmic adaptor subunit, partial [Bacillales bacterium]|nr:efflux RND transporter periplasmic adaptor subunit [Bacillales bacterium]